MSIVILVSLISIIIILVTSIKYYTFDVPNQDKKLYELDSLRDELNALATNGTVQSESDEFLFVSQLLENEYLLIRRGVPIRLVVDLLVFEPDKNIKDKIEKNMSKIKNNDSLDHIYEETSIFFEKNIVPSIKRKASFLSFVAFALKPIVILIKVKYEKDYLKKLEMANKVDALPLFRDLGYEKFVY